MLLLLDAGNTRLKWAAADADGVILKSAAIDYVDMAVGFKRLALSYDFEDVIVSSVAGAERNHLLKLACMHSTGLEPKFAKVVKSACGIENKYQSIERLGVDRWVAAMGVSAEVGVNRIVVDAGTAVTVDLVDADNNFLGGVILPGSKLMHDSLVGETAGIVSVRKPVLSVIGQNTTECVNAGVQFGLVGAVERVINEICAFKCDDRPWRVLFCGGDAELIADAIKIKFDRACSPNLLFAGLINLYRDGGIE